MPTPQTTSWVSLVIALISAGSAILGVVLSNRARRKHDKTEEGLAALAWAQEFEKRTQAAERKAADAEKHASETERRSIETDRRLASYERQMADLVEVITWVGEVVELAHDASDPDHTRLVRKINGGPPAYHRNRT